MSERQESGRSPRRRTDWSPALNGRKCDGPGGCGHALSMHNSLGYCRSHSTRDGHCVCGEPSSATRQRDMYATTSTEGETQS